MIKAAIQEEDYRVRRKSSRRKDILWEEPAVTCRTPIRPWWRVKWTNHCTPWKITVLCGGMFGKRPYYLPDAPSKRPRRTKEDDDRPQTLMGGPQ
jgi:hypothetical protein